MSKQRVKSPDEVLRDSAYDLRKVLTELLAQVDAADQYYTAKGQGWNWQGRYGDTREYARAVLAKVGYHDPWQDEAVPFN